MYFRSPLLPVTHRSSVKNKVSCVFETIRATVGHPLPHLPLSSTFFTAVAGWQWSKCNVRCSAALARIRRRDKKGMWNISGSAAGRHLPAYILDTLHSSITTLYPLQCCWETLACLHVVFTTLHYIQVLLHYTHLNAAGRHLPANILPAYSYTSFYI